MASKFSPPLTKADFVYEKLHDEISSGRLDPGRRLRLAELAARYDISEMPVREALRKLQQDGLVDFENHRGATVADLGLTRVIEIIATRTHLEVLAMCEATPFHTTESIAKLDSLTAKMRLEKNAANYSALNHRFHKMLCAPSPNAFLNAEIDNLWNKVWRTHRHSVFERVPERISGAQDEHEEIVNAIRSGSVRAVEKAARQHRDRTLAGWKSAASAASNNPA